MFDVLIRDWDAHLAHEKRRSDHTRRAYIATAERFCGFLAHHRGGAVDARMLKGLTPNDLRSYLADRRADGLGNASAARELSALRSFLRFVGGSNASVPQMRGPRVKKGLPRPVAPAEAMQLAQDVEDNARDAWVGARDFALLLLLYGAGLRIGEALSLTGKDVGTPILHIAPPEGAAFFGPVISRVPSDEDALRLWDHVVGLATFPGFAEMKRSLRELPQLRALGVAEDEVGRTEDWHGGSRRLKK